MSAESHLAAFEARLEAAAAAWGWPAELAGAARWALFGGGKRVRPRLALLSAEAVSPSPGATPGEAALDWAMAVELLHTYSLIHDDLPAMDDDDERRGRPTVHVKFGEALAILAGDALLTEAFAVVAAMAAPAERVLRLVGLLAAAGGGAGMIAGQVEDIGGGLETAADVLEMQRKKTGALILAAVVGGAEAMGADTAAREALSRYGVALGALFQVTDDLLDAAQDEGRDGVNLLHRQSREAVLARRDALAAEAREALSPLGARGDALVALVESIAHRDV